ncbi:hypothetical protein ES707_16147 [subsurface metagenome]
MNIKKIIFSRADNLKIEMFCLWNGMKTPGILVPMMFAEQFQKEMTELRSLISKEEYQEFLSKCFGVKLENAVEQAEDIIKKKRSK